MDAGLMHMYVCVCVYMHTYIYIHISTYVHTHQKDFFLSTLVEITRILPAEVVYIYMWNQRSDFIQHTTRHMKNSEDESLQKDF
jgi:hypothetical protein